jgi:sialate O-acetylesterase
MKIEKNSIKLSFEYSEGGLASRNGDLKEFAIAGADKKFYPANARIEDSTIVVSAKEVNEPAAARFAWKNAAQSNYLIRLDSPHLHSVPITWINIFELDGSGDVDSYARRLSASMARKFGIGT